MFHADLHIHSKYSRACSKDCDLEHLAWWALRKGITVVGTGDFTHPAWAAELRDKLVPAEPGLFRLRPDLERQVRRTSPPSQAQAIRFMLSVEISTIYRRAERTRKVHHLLYAPSLDAAGRITTALARIGNLAADGRPILGLDSRDLLEITLASDPGSYLVPAHVWTPWFAVLGSKSGFDAVADCYADLAEHIFAIETGLSADPPMNWMCSALDGYRFVSNSDAHSPPMLGREATTLRTDLDYFAIRRALETGEGLAGTVEFFPEEGKYHLDGHRKCGVRLTPEQTRAHGGNCPECEKPLTVGVLHRVAELADRPHGYRPPGAPQSWNLVPLPEIVSEIVGVGRASKRVTGEVGRLVGALGPELVILREVPPDEIARIGGSLLAEAITRLRRGEVRTEAGFDGVYGTVRLLSPEEAQRPATAQVLFETVPAGRVSVPSQHASPKSDPQRLPQRVPTADAEGSGRSPRQAGTPAGGSGESGGSGGSSPRTDTALAGAPVGGSGGSPPNTGARAATRRIGESGGSPPRTDTALATGSVLDALDADQRAAAVAQTPLLIIAGPGTGKTRTLTHRIAHLVTDRGVAPSQCLAITFTRRAAQELRDRLALLVPAAPVPAAPVPDTPVPDTPAAAALSSAVAAPAVAGNHVAGTPAPADRAADPPSEVTVTTFHGLGLRILREHHDLAGLRERFGVADDATRLAVATELAGSAQRARDLLADPAGLDLLRKELLARGLVDFDGLVEVAGRLLRDEPELARAYRRRWPHISVDEYQDMDGAQYCLLRLLADPGGTGLTVIGDPDQAIYGFRGADVGYFLRFTADYPAATTTTLCANYRSGPAIVAGAQQAIAPSTLVPGRRLHSITSDPRAAGPIVLHEATDEYAEAAWIAAAIDELLGGASLHSLDSGRADGHGLGGLGFADIAVLYRTDAGSGPLLQALTRAGLPFQKHSHDRLADRPGVQLLMHELRLAMPDPAGPDPAGPDPAGPFRAGPQEPAETALLRVARAVAGRFPATASEATDVRAAAEVLRPLARRCGSDLDRFRTEIALGAEADAADPRADSVALLTLHAAKGLEFEVVFLAGCEHGLLPLRLPGAAPQGHALRAADVAEERRLLFVGMTRARTRLLLTCARRRTRWGAERAAGPSPFLAAIDADLLTRSTSAARRRSTGRQLRLL